MVTLVENIRDAPVNELNLYLDTKEVFQDKKDIGPGNWVRETISLGRKAAVGRTASEKSRPFQTEHSYSNYASRGGR